MHGPWTSLPVFEMKWFRHKAFWVSWYQEPRGIYPVAYVMKNVEGDWDYTYDKSKAFRFATKDEALAVTPAYDGSADIQNRRGVKHLRSGPTLRRAPHNHKGTVG